MATKLATVADAKDRLEILAEIDRKMAELRNSSMLPHKRISELRRLNELRALWQNAPMRISKP